MWRSVGVQADLTQGRQTPVVLSYHCAVGWRAVVMTALVLAETGCGTALAVRSNGFGVLAGTGYEFVPSGKQAGEGTDGPLSAAVEVLYERRLKEGETIALHLDVPVAVLPDVKTARVNANPSRSYSALFVIPGVSLQLPGRLSFFIGAGGGLVRLRAHDALAGSVGDRAGRTAIRGAGHITSGYEFHVTARLGVRVNIRALFPGGQFPATRPGPQPVVDFAGTFGALIHF
jgi:hypothetical protein